MVVVVAVSAFPPPEGPETALRVIGAVAALAVGARAIPAIPAAARLSVAAAATAVRRLLSEVMRIW